ncbi:MULTISPECIES: nucleoside-diphosphate kinase [Limnochorda]|uniref:nucleoside-diphosphate kinase n=1 Tax=Limnochorda TaxID=1676651 RepID=UPI001797AE79|nr:nucleoside-diphosphate kinase [Limnochorda pilosa]MBO2485844.1 nucleoside-diphosphate kinase [Bacillota bacterium]MBO2519218.1 nucleoside-diphosphate kinase [Bacillota bacterium]NMA71057.1 nucleoside-diphosphate kinase [Bacillota bacterium]
MEQTFIIIKPEAVQRGLVGEILRRFEAKGLKIRRLEMRQISEEVAREHYGHHADKPFFPELLQAITAGPAVLGVLEGPDCIRHVRNLVGATNPLEAQPGTIRGDFATELPYTIVHAADSPEAAAAEIQRFFGS